MTHYGFNAQWMLVDQPESVQPVDERMLDFMARQGFNFLRLPTSYRAWTAGFDYLHPEEAALANIDRCLEACRSRGIHLSLNLHRAPGYCITRNDLEIHNLWLDTVAQDAFLFLWATFAARFQDTPAEHLSFDLVNEPPAPGVAGFTRDNHAALMRRVVAAIRTIDSKRPITIDGLDGGNLAMPELADLGVTHSGRGYQPYPVTHWGADWWQGWHEGDAPRYPGVLFEGRIWDRDALRTFYQPWRDVEQMGASVHIGEMGCYNRTPNADALRWFSDEFDLLREFRWGYAMWNFDGPFGIVGHGRPGARVEVVDGYPVDRDPLDLMHTGRDD